MAQTTITFTICKAWWLVPSLWVVVFIPFVGGRIAAWLIGRGMSIKAGD